MFASRLDALLERSRLLRFVGYVLIGVFAGVFVLLVLAVGLTVAYMLNSGY